MSELDECGFKDRFFVSEGQNFAEVLGGRVVVDSENDTGQFAGAERCHDAAARSDAMTETEWKFIGEETVERDWQ